MTEDAGFLLSVGAYDFSVFHNVQTGSESLASSYEMGTAGVKRGGHETEQSPASSAEVKNGDAILPRPH